MKTSIPLYSQPLAEPIDRGFDACGVPNTPTDPYEALLARLRSEAVPFSALWEMTHVCNLDCVMCYNVPLAEPELSTEEGLDLLEQLAAAGTLRLTLTGGEILTRRDFFTLAERARKLGFALNLKTNATLLTPATADRVAALSPVLVDISLLGATSATFDAVAQSSHTLERVVRGVRLLRERGVRVRLGTVLSALNVAERAAMVELAYELDAYYEQWFKISAADDGRTKAAEYQLPLTQMVTVLEDDQTSFEPRLFSSSSRTCQVGLASCAISPYGEVYPCLELRTSAGNVRRQSFAEIWKSSPIFQDLRTRHTFANLHECQICPINQYCEARCSGLAWKEHGNPYAGHSLACQHAQARYMQQNPGLSAPRTPLQIRVGANGSAAKG